MTNRRGFTLMEVLVALALVIALLGAMFAFLFDMLSTRAQVLEASQRRRAAGLLVDRIERDLMTCLAGGRERGAGVRGDATSLSILSRDVPVRVAARGGRDGATFADLERSEYRFRAGAIEARRTVLRRGAAGAPEPFHALGTVPRLHFRYFDGRAWQDEYDSLRAGGLPVAVEVAVWFRPWPEDAVLESEPVEFEGEEEPVRRTFDAGAGFDEDAFARASDFDDPPPVPDRVRVILVPDAVAEPVPDSVTDPFEEEVE